MTRMDRPEEIKRRALELARGFGFACAGVAPVGRSPRVERFDRFVERGYCADMDYLRRTRPTRADARRMLEGAAAVICLAVPYAPAPPEEATGHVARYARGRDYHRLLRKRCGRLIDSLRAEFGDMAARICVDTAPVSDRDLAARAGLGWIGRNGCLIHPRWGSYLLLAEIIVDVPLPPDAPLENRCLDCGRCAEACPTGAITDDGLVDARRCISYLTVENRGSIPEEFRRAMGGRVFGCDACQEACPYNAVAKAPPGDPALRGPSELARTPAAAILAWAEADWDRLTRGSACRRAKFDMFLRNAAVAVGNAGDPAVRADLQRLARHRAPAVAEAAGWALAQLP